ncbi:MAG: 50S ribosomal protein L29 [Saprospiraceae bacterium]|nr:50S ribosomal protein L29 [Saprospiraceae bacterium]
MTTQDIKNINDNDLQQQLESLQEEIKASYFQHKSSGLQNPKDLPRLRKEIARIKTEQRKRELNQMSETDLENRSKIRLRRR